MSTAVSPSMFAEVRRNAAVKYRKMVLDIFRGGRIHPEALGSVLGLLGLNLDRFEDDVRKLQDRQRSMKQREEAAKRKPEIEVLKAEHNRARVSLDQAKADAQRMVQEAEQVVRETLNALSAARSDIHEMKAAADRQLQGTLDPKIPEDIQAAMQQRAYFTQMLAAAHRDMAAIERGRKQLKEDCDVFSRWRARQVFEWPEDEGGRPRVCRWRAELHDSDEQPTKANVDRVENFLKTTGERLAAQAPKYEVQFRNAEAGVRAADAEIERLTKLREAVESIAWPSGEPAAEVPGASDPEAGEVEFVALEG